MSVKSMDEFTIKDVDFLEGMEQVAQDVVDALKSASPVKTLKLKNSIKYKLEKNRLTFYSTSNTLHFVERGVVSRVKKNGASTGSMPAKPFFFSTINKFDNQIKEQIKTNSKEVVE